MVCSSYVVRLQCITLLGDTATKALARDGISRGGGPLPHYNEFPTPSPQAFLMLRNPLINAVLPGYPRVQTPT